MTRGELFNLIRRKALSLAGMALSAFALMAVMYLAYKAVLFLLPQAAQSRWESLLAGFAQDPETLKAWFLEKGRRAPWFFMAAQVLQVSVAPVPGQAVALAGGYIFGFWKGLALTMAGLTAGSLAAMALARWLGTAFVRRVVPESVMKAFDSLVTQGGYSNFFIIFLLPALPDDALCFIAGLTRLKLAPLTALCLAGRAPGMAVLSLVGSQLSGGLSPGVKALFALLMVLSVPLWLFWEELAQRARRLSLKPRREAAAEQSGERRHSDG